MQDNAMHWLACAERQLYMWVRGVIENMGEDTQNENAQDDVLRAVYPWLLEHDPLFARIESLPPDIIQREKYFFSNSIRGISDYVARIDETRRREIVSRAGSDWNDV
jgi:hypothetical protein